MVIETGLIVDYRLGETAPWSRPCLRHHQPLLSGLQYRWTQVLADTGLGGRQKEWRN